MSGVYTGSYGVSVTLNSSHPDVTLASSGTVDAYGPLGTFTFEVNGTLTAEPLVGALGGPAGTVFTVNNFGLIETRGTSASNQFDLGVVLAAGSVINAGEILGASGAGVLGDGGPAVVSNEGVIEGSIGVGVFLGSGGTLRNTGSIAGAQTGVDFAGSVAVYLSNASTGIISAAVNYGVQLAGPGLVVNAGVILGTEGGLQLGPGGTLENSGRIGETGVPTGTYANYAGLDLYQNGTIFNSLGGEIYGANGISGQGSAGSYIFNAGSIKGTQKDGVQLFDGPVSLVNSGTILSAATVSNAQGGYAGVYLAGGATVVNEAGGLIKGPSGIRIMGPGTNEVANAGVIRGGGTGASGIYFRIGGTVSNTGSIIGGRHGVVVEGSGGYGFGSISNSGLIEATTETVSTDGTIHKGSAIALLEGGNVSNAVHGTIAGAVGVYLRAAPTGDAGAIGLENAGTIIGTYHIGVNLETPGYVQNSGGIYGGHDAVYLVAGGQLNNEAGGTLNGAHNGVYVLSGTAMLANDGVIAGAQGDGVLLSNGGTLTNASFGLISAGGYAVHDNGAAGYILNQGTLAGQDGVLVFNTASGATTVVNTGTISAVYEGISLAESFAAAGLGLVVNDGQVSESAASEVSGSNTFTPDAVQIETFGTLLNEAGGTISAAGFGVADFAASGPASVSNAGVIYGALGGIQSGFYDALSITNSGSIGGGAGNGVSLGDAGRLVNEAGGRITGGQSAVQGNGASAYVLNLGQIGGTNGISVFTTATGATTLINEGTIAVSYGALDLYETFGVAGAGLVENDGLVSSSAATETGIGGVTFNATAVNIETGAMFVNEAGATVSAAGFAFGDFNTPGAALMVNDGLIEGALGAVSVGADEQLTLVNAGTIESSAGGGVYLGGGGTLVDSGLIEAASGYAALGAGSGALELVLDAGAKLVGGVFTDASFSNVLQLAGNMAGSFDLGGSVNGFGTIMFAPGVDWALGGNQQELAGGEIIQGFTAGDTIVLDGVNDLAGEDSYTVAIAGTLSVDADGTFYNLLIAGATVGQSDFVLSSGLAITEVTCYVAGTRILTETGEMPVEAIKIGDRLPTLHGGLRAVKWIGRRSYDGRFIARNKRALPVCIKAGALRDGVPKRDLWVSPGHAIYLDGALVHAGRLVNGVSIIQPMQVDRVDYYHIEMETHEVIFAEGCAAETFLDEHFRGLFQNAAEFGTRYPGQSAPARLCLARLDAGRGLAARRRRLAARAFGQGKKEVAFLKKSSAKDF